MFTLKKEQQAEKLVVTMAGSIEESVHFDQLLGQPASFMEVNCKAITRINSIGVKSWISFFQSAQAAGARLVFVECSTAIVEQMNLISNFRCGGEVASIYVPFACPACKAELLGLFKTEDLRNTGLSLPELQCTQCSKNAVFDDIPEEYFGFLSENTPQP